MRLRSHIISNIVCGLNRNIITVLIWGPWAVWTIPLKYRKYRHKVFKWCIPGHTTSQWQSTFQKFIRPSILRWACTLLVLLAKGNVAFKYLMLPIVLVSSGCFNKIPYMGCWNNRSVFSQNSKVGSLKSGSQPGCVLLRALLLA